MKQPLSQLTKWNASLFLSEVYITGIRTRNRFQNFVVPTDQVVEALNHGNVWVIGYLFLKMGPKGFWVSNYSNIAGFAPHSSAVKHIK